MRKQHHHPDDLVAPLAQLRKENNQIITSLSVKTQHFLNVEGENSCLKAQIGELCRRLDSLNEIIGFLNSDGGVYFTTVETTTPLPLQPDEGLKRWLTDRFESFDNTTPNGLVPVESHMSDVDGYVVAAAATKVHLQPQRDLVFDEATCDQINGKEVGLNNLDLFGHFFKPTPLVNGRETMQLDLSYQQSLDAINNERMAVSEQQIDIAVTSSQENGRIKTPEGEHKKTGVRISIPLEDILKTSNMSLNDAAKELNVSRSTLKRACREYQIHRWPPRKRNKLSHPCPSESLVHVDQEQIPQLNSDLPSNQVLTTVVHTKPRGTAIQDADIVTVKARYVNDITIRFRLSWPSELAELEQKVARRLNLEAGTYYIKYKDEDDESILIACDEDWQDYVCSYRSRGDNWIAILLEPK